MDWPSFSQHFAAYALGIGLLAGFLVYRNAKGTGAASMSKSASSSTSNMVFLGVSGLLVTSLVIVYVFGFLYEATAVPQSFFVLFFAALLALAVTLLAPDNKTTAGKTHHWSAHILTFLIMPMTALLYVQSERFPGKGQSYINATEELLGVAFVLILVGIWTYRLQLNIKDKSRFISQQLYFLVFLVALTLRAYL